MTNDSARKSHRRASAVSRRKALRDLGALALSAPLLACSKEEPVLLVSGGGAAPDAGSAAAAQSGGRSAEAQSSGGQAAPRNSEPAAPRQAAHAAASGAGPAAASGATPVAGSRAASAAGSGGAGGADAGASAAAGAPASGGAGSAAPVSGASSTGTVDFATLDCVLTPEMTEGPFFVEEDLNRSDLIAGETAASVTAGLPLELTLGVFRVNGAQCSAFADAMVDIWHADVEGVYSDVSPNFLQSQDTSGKNFLRAQQTTNESGVVKFKTIYPGWYSGRAIHIHFKIRIEGAGGAGYDFTSQMFFDEDINDEVMAMAAYNARGERTIRNMNDQVFNGTGPGGLPDSTPPANGVAPGAAAMVGLTPLAGSKGYAAVLKIGVVMT